MGALGGKVVSGYHHGEAAAQMVVKILNGVDVRSIPVLLDSPNRYMFDYNVMQRFNIAENDLPQGSILINKPGPFYAAHREVIITALGIIGFLSIIIVLLVINTVQRRRSSEVIRRSEELFKVITSSNPDHILIQDNELRYSFVLNPQLGLTEQDMIGKTDHDFLSKEDADTLTEIKRQVLKTSQTVHAEVPLISSKGEQQFFDGSYIPKFDVKGQIDGLIGYFRNVTERKQAEEALKAERQRLHDVLETMPIMICLLTPDYHVAFANRAFREKFGESHGRHCYEYCFGKKEPCDFCETYRVLKTAKPHRWQVTTPDGASVIDAFDYPFTDLDGSPMILEVDIDITDRKQAEEKIKASLREKETMLKEIHHRVKNNLQVISSLLSLQATYLQDEKAREALQNSIERVKTLASIHTQLYESQDLTKIDFCRFIQELIGNISQSYGRTESPVEIHVDVGEIRIGIDNSIPCGLILNELVSNALKHAFPEGKEGEINIRMQSENNHMALTVQDNGIGFPESIDLTKAKSLGLELVNLLVGQMNGKIDMQVDGGTTWTITFPIKNDREWRNE